MVPSTKWVADGRRGMVALGVAGALLAGVTSCGSRDGNDLIARRDGPHPGVAEVEPGKADIAAVDGQSIYVPAYSAVATADNLRLYQLAITLSVRNTDRDRPIVVTAVRYHDQDGRLVREFLKKPLRVAPLAATEFFVRESDKSGGTAASFWVEWIAEQAVSDPVVEAVMIGTLGNQGISFTCPGRVVADRGR